MPLPPAPDPNAMRNAILARLGLTPGQAAGFAGNSGFDDEITNYYRQATGAMGDLDLNEARLGTDYESQLAQMIQERDRGRRSMEDMFADRGMLSSSNFTDEMSKYLGDYGQRQSDLGQNRTRGLEDITRNRNSVLEEFERNRMGTESQYATQLQDYLMAQVKPPVAPTAPAAAPALARPVVRPAVRPAAPRVASPTVPKVGGYNPLPTGSARVSQPVAARRPTSGSRTVRPV